MNVEKTLENIREKCDSYIDPELLVTSISDDYYMGSNENIGVENLEFENIFINLGLLTFAPIINECDIYSFKDSTVKLSAEEFNSYEEIKDEYFGILVKKNSCEYIIGTCDVCGCKIDSKFTPLNKNGELYKELEKLVNEVIIK